jgi:hypothetical protein
MNPLPDRKKLRREYLRKKGLFYLVRFGFPSFMVACCLLVVHPRHSQSPFIHDILMLLAAISSAAWIMLTEQVKNTDWMRKHTTYVPPVKRSTLPAEEILVRGAGEPTAPTETLLRATVKDEAARAEELLRVSRAVTGEPNL